MKELTLEDYQTKVKNGRYYALIAYTADWHDKFESTKKSLEIIQPKNEKLLTVGWIDVTKYPEAVKGTKLTSLPHFVLYKGGEIMSEFEGLYSKWDLQVYLGEDLYKFIIG